MNESSPALTELLRAAQAGDPAAADAATAVVYHELRTLAAGFVGRERADHTLQPTALVHEAYLRLLGQETPWRNRAHFFGIAAQMMRRILVDHARHSSAARRDRRMMVPLDEAGTVPVDAIQDVLDVHEALSRLEQMDARQARVVELKFFVGLSLDEIADVLDISPATVSREWGLARRWLHRDISSR